MKGSISTESTGQQSLSFCNVDRLIVDYQRPINNDLRNRFINIQKLIVQDCEQSFYMLIQDIVPYIDMANINTFVIGERVSEFDEDIFIQFIFSMSHLHSITMPIDLLRLLFVKCWLNINRLKILPQRRKWSARFTDKGFTLEEVDMLISSFNNMEQISFHSDTMPHLCEFLTNVPKRLSTLVIEHFIDNLPIGIRATETNKLLNKFKDSHRIYYKFDENQTAIVWL
ncbi:unnamed protein product [Rotaria magnacalcarata]|nr:unnamed protein product [Rotaria magnacalcarata]CAF3832197.1 unnamed protein product [Rotaria magnacalcarata]CAF3843147.1 unnamed protein product [Rotaria magnacalcarata]CAF3922073.1 unnamed protein product [Rotaria magnacalcarata]